MTWPEGNGWLAERLRERLEPRLVTRALAWRLSKLDRAVLVDTWQPNENRSVRRLTQRVIWAAPVFQAPRVFRELSPEQAAAIGEFQYAPWLVANLSLRRFPEERRGAPLAGTTCCTTVTRWVMWSPPINIGRRIRTRPCSPGIRRSATARRTRNDNAC